MKRFQNILSTTKQSNGSLSICQEAKAKQDLSHALGYFHRQMELSSDERDVAHGRVSRLEAELTAMRQAAVSNALCRAPARAW